MPNELAIYCRGKKIIPWGFLHWWIPMISSVLTNGFTIVVNYSYDNRLSYILLAFCCKTMGIPYKLSNINSLISHQEYQETNLLTYKEEKIAPPPEGPKPWWRWTTYGNWRTTRTNHIGCSSTRDYWKCIGIVHISLSLSLQVDLLSNTYILIPCVVYIMQGLDEINPMAAELEQSNALALAIIQPGIYLLITNPFLFLHCMNTFIYIYVYMYRH